MKFLAFLALLFATPAVAQQVPAPLNAPASVTSGHALCATANRQQAADCGAALGGLATLAGATQGQIIYWNGSSWALLTAGTSGQHLTTLGSGANPAWAATPLGPGYISGHYYFPPNANGITTATLGSANMLYAVPFYAWLSQTFTKIGIDVATGAASTSCEIGVYNNNGGVPGSLLVDAGNVSVASTGIQEVTGVSIPLAQGWYWLAIGCNGTPGLDVFSAIAFGQYLGWNTFTQYFMSVQIAWFYAAGALPATFGTGTFDSAANQAPMVSLRF
ncbi:MAG TPA: hypothetical protein VH020_03305 [Stellaceae bacterium]|nr:hypothetical protein [Stellaceae bacterium]